MSRAWIVGIASMGAVFAWSAQAGAQEPEPEPAPPVTTTPAPETAPPPPVSAGSYAFATKPRPTPGRVGLVESSLRPADRTTVTPPHWTGDIDRPDAPLWVQRMQVRHDRFVQPFLLPSVLPEISARLFNSAGVVGGTENAAFDQILYLSFYFLEIYAPTLVYRDDTPFSPQHYRLNLRVPALVRDHHALSVFFGAALPTSGPLAQNAGANTMIGYAFGSDLFSVQARAGIGNDRLVGEYDAAFRTVLLYDAAAALFLGDHFGVQLQADGRRDLGAVGNAVRLWPGVRYYPSDRRHVSLGASALWWVDQNPAGDWATRRIGGFFDLGYQFL